MQQKKKKNCRRNGADLFWVAGKLKKVMVMKRRKIHADIRST